MAFPGKTSPEAIRSAAIALLEREGSVALTIRGVASALDLAPNALYRYYPSRETLIAAVANEVAKRLLAAINQALDTENARREPPDVNARSRVRALADVYAEFARANPALYETLMTDTSGAEAGLPRPLGHDELWNKVIEVLTPLSGSANAPSAAVTLWGMMHGMWTLERANLLGGKKPIDVGRFGVDAFIRGLCA
jgi:AcrR family transcriptional regulator